MKLLKKTLLIILVAALLLAAVAGAGYGGLGLAMNHNAKKIVVADDSLQKKEGAHRIHFLNTGSSDAILLESDGRFALIDAGEDWDFPADKPHLDYTGYEEEVVAYLKQAAGDKDGKVTLDFVLGTHAHSDHIGGFDTVAADLDITIHKAYLKEYREQSITTYEREKWDNREVYDQMVNALQERKVPIISDLPTAPFALGEFSVQFFNTEYDTSGNIVGENDNSVGVKVSKGAKTAFLAGDLDNVSGDEDRIGPLVGKVDLLKPGHHGYSRSTSRGFAKALNPDIVVITNHMMKATPDVKLTLTAISKSAIFSTVSCNGILAEFTDDGQISLSKNTFQKILE